MAQIKERERVALPRYSLSRAAALLGCTVRTIWRRISEGWLTLEVERIPGKERNTNYVPQREVDLLLLKDWDGLKEFHRQHYPDVPRPYLLVNGKRGK